MPNGHLPLAGLLVIDLSQFLAGPYASLRLQDLGARVIKVERPDGGDLSRQLYLFDTLIDGDSTNFHAINRGKESISLNLKDEDDRRSLRALIAKADVVIQNFRPGVIERLGFDYKSVQEFAPHVVYGSVSGYGPKGPWDKYPGQDLLAQARSGAMWLNGSADDGPVPFGLSIADMLAGANLAQGILAGLVRRGVTGRGALVETSLLESMIDLQFEVLANHLNDGGCLPQRSWFRSAHVGLAAPYGVYATRDGWLAIAMTPLPRLAELIEARELDAYADRPDAWFTERDQIKRVIASRIVQLTTDEWIGILEPHDIWCAKVLNWQDLLADDVFRGLDMLQSVPNGRGTMLRLTRSPLRFDGERGASNAAAPSVGEHTRKIRDEFDLS